MDLTVSDSQLNTFYLSELSNSVKGEFVPGVLGEVKNFYTLGQALRQS